MKHAFLVVCIVLSGSLCVPASAEAQVFAKPGLVREVVDGKRSEARVSWWGFDPKDSTQFLQQAIDSNVRKLIIDRQELPWVTRPLTGVSDQEIVFEKGAELVALKGAFHPKGDCLLSFRECENVIIRGERSDGGKPARIRMHKEDYQSDAYEKSEWRHGLVLSGCRNVLIQDLAIEKTGGDGIYLGASYSKGPNVNVVIRRVDCNGNHRQGISVISAANLLIENCLLRNTRGTAPQAGIDFEPNGRDEFLANCVMRNCIAENNAGTGYQVCPQSMNSRSKPISVYLKNCVSRGNRQHAIHLCSAPNDPPGGLLRITHFVSENDSMAGLAVQFNPFDAMRVEMEDSAIRDSARNDSFFPPIYVQGSGSDSRPMGNIDFTRVTIKDDVDRPFLRLRGAGKGGVKSITGDITLKRRGHTQRIAVDDAWLRSILGSAESSR